MDRMLYLAMTGAKHALQAQQHNSHNLANANTPGFRADLERLMTLPVNGPGLPSRVYSQTADAGSDLTAGSVMSTGRELDVAIDGDGWIAVQAADATEAYTRRGDLRLNPMGLLETGSGELVLGNGGPIAVPPAQQLTIGVDGTVSVVPLGQAANTLAVVDRIRLVNPEPQQLVKGDDGLFRLTGGEPAEPDAAVTLRSGVLEGSNVNVVDSLVKMIDSQRSYETYVKLISTAKQNDESSSRLLRSGG